MEIDFTLDLPVRPAIHCQVDMTGTPDETPNMPDLITIHCQVDLKRLVYLATYYLVHMTGVIFQVHLSCLPDSEWPA